MEAYDWLKFRQAFSSFMQFLEFSTHFHRTNSSIPLSRKNTEFNSTRGGAHSSSPEKASSSPENRPMTDQETEDFRKEPNISENTKHFRRLPNTQTRFYGSGTKKMEGTQSMPKMNQTFPKKNQKPKPIF